VSRSPVATGPTLYGKRILIVEDDDRLYCALKDALQDMGCEVFGSCAHVASLWDSAPNAHVDAALIDDAGAPQIPALIRQLEDLAIPVVMIGARATTQRSGPLSHYPQLTKPFTEEDLVYSIVAAIGARCAGSKAHAFGTTELPVAPSDFGH
jgi:DNA-binding response OmpR family regulator